MKGMARTMFGLNNPNTVIGIITLLLAFFILRKIKKMQLIIYSTIILLSILSSYILNYNETISVITGSIFTAVLMNLFDYFYERKRNKKIKHK